MPKTKVRFRVDFDAEHSVGPGKISLLETISACGSLSQAARELGMSYRRAWLLVASVNQAFRRPVTHASAGGRQGGGMELTEFGRELVRRYRGLERRIEACAARELRGLAHELVTSRRTRDPVSRRALPRSSVPDRA